MTRGGGPSPSPLRHEEEVRYLVVLWEVGLSSKWMFISEAKIAYPYGAIGFGDLHSEQQVTTYLSNSP